MSIDPRSAVTRTPAPRRSHDLGPAPRFFGAMGADAEHGAQDEGAQLPNLEPHLLPSLAC